MDFLGIFKGAVEIAVSIGASTIVGNAVKLTKAPDAKLPMRIATGFGAFVLSSMIGDAAGKYATKQIDDIADRVKDIFHKVDEVKINEADVQDSEKLENIIRTPETDLKNVAKVFVDPETKEYKENAKQEGE